MRPNYKALIGYEIFYRMFSPYWGPDRGASCERKSEGGGHADSHRPGRFEIFIPFLKSAECPT
jgi:hypothetical protein